MNKYNKLIAKLNKKNYTILAKELNSVCYPVGKHRLYLGHDIWITAKSEFPIEVRVPHDGCFKSVYFQNLRQVQRWADNGFKDTFLPAFEYNDGSIRKQTSNK